MPMYVQDEMSLTAVLAIESSPHYHYYADTGSKLCYQCKMSTVFSGTF